jgi:CBS domain-containing protein
MDATESLRTIPAISLAHRHLIRTWRGTPIRSSIHTLRDETVGCVAVVDDQRLVGIVTERDLVARAYAPGIDGDTPVETIMTAAPRCLGPNDSVADALRLFVEADVRHLPIVDDDGRPIAVLTSDDVLELIADAAPEATHNLPPEPAARRSLREGG